MIQVSVFRGQQLTNMAKFETQDEANTWIQLNTLEKAFGKPERWIHEDDLTALHEDKTQAIESEFVGGPEDEKKRYKFPAEYRIEQKDITAEVQQAISNEEARQYLELTDWFVIRKMETGIEIPQEILTKRTEARSSIVE